MISKNTMRLGIFTKTKRQHQIYKILNTSDIFLKYCEMHRVSKFPMAENVFKFAALITSAPEMYSFIS